MSRANPRNSTCVQALLDMKAVGLPIEESLIQEIKANPGLLAKADRKLAMHMYPDKSIKYIQVYRDALPLYSALSANAQALYILMVLNVGSSGLVAISGTYMTQYLDCSKRAVKGIVEELINSTLIALHTPGRPKNPAIYALNPEYASIGKGRASHAIWADIDVSGTVPKRSEWGHDTIRRADGTVYSLITPTPKKEEPSPEDAVDSSTNSNHKQHITRKRKRASEDNIEIPGQMRFEHDGTIITEDIDNAVTKEIDQELPI